MIQKQSRYFIYFLHEDGEMMLYTRDESDDSTRWTPYHKVSSINMPHLWKHKRAAENWARFTINNLHMIVAEWKGIYHVRANPYGRPEATLKRAMKDRVN